MGLLAAERHEVVLGRLAREHGAVGDTTHRDVADDRAPVRARNADREWIRAGERRAAVWVRESRRGGRGQRGDQAATREPPHPVAQHPRRKAVRRNDDARPLGRVGELGIADRGQRQVAQGAVAVPALESRFCGGPSWLSSGIQIGQRFQPVDTREAMTPLAPGFRVQKVFGENSCVFLPKTELLEPPLHRILTACTESHHVGLGSSLLEANQGGPTPCAEQSFFF